MRTLFTIPFCSYWSEKKIVTLFLLTVFFIAVTVQGRAQVSQYRFSVLSSAFKDLTTGNYPGATIAADVTLNTLTYNTARQYVPQNKMPFDFPFYTTDANGVPLTLNLRNYGFTVCMAGYIIIGDWVVPAIEGNGYISQPLGTGASGIQTYPTAVGVISMFYNNTAADYTPSASYIVRYGIVGTVPNRSFVIQLTTDSKTQVWFNEADYSIQIRYDGTNNLGSNPSVGLRGGSASDYYCLSTGSSSGAWASWASPTRAALNTAKMMGTISTTSTMVYNWLPTIYSPSYASLPYTKDFESAWLGQSSAQNVPDNHWKQQTPNGNFAWMREDNGATAGWYSPASGAYSPSGAGSSSHSARFHTNVNGAFTNAQTGVLYLYIDATGTEAKNLSFDYINADGTDNLALAISEDGGLTYTSLGANLGVSTGGTWQSVSRNFGANSATTIIRFTATRDNSGTSDIGIDNISVTTTSNCIVPTLTARFNGVAGSSNKCKTEGNNILSANPNGAGAPGSDYLEYNWYNGTNYWNGSSFSSASPVWNSVYVSIIIPKASITASTTSYTVNARWKNSSCTNPASSAVSWTNTSMFESPTLIPTAAGVSGIYSCGSGTIPLAAGAVGGTFIGTVNYAWNDGAPRNSWWNTTWNSGNTALYQSAWSSINSPFGSGWQNLYPGYLPVTVKTYTAVARNQSNTACTTSGAVTVASVAPVIISQPLPIKACIGQTATFTVYARGAATYKWRKNGIDLTDGGNISGSTTATLSISNVSASDVANYSVALANNCAGSPTISSAVGLTADYQAPSVTAKANGVAGILNVAGPLSVTLTANSTGGIAFTGNFEYSWSDGYRFWDGVGFNAYYPVYNSAYTSITLNVSETTTFSVTARCSDDWLCSNSSQVIVQFPVSGGCTAPTSVISGTLTGCISPGVALGTTGSLAGGSATISGYQWKNTAGIISGATLSTYTATATDNYTVVITNSCGSTAASSASSVTAHLNPAATISGTTGCVSPGIILDASGSTAGSGTISAFQWKNTGGNINGATNSTYTATSNSNYTVVVTNSNFCTAISPSSAVTANANPTITASVVNPVSAQICLSESATLSCGGGVSYSWLPDSDLDDNTVSSPIASPSVTTTYTVIGTDINGCTNSSTTVLTVKPLPPLVVTPSSAVCTGSASASLTASGADSYTWSPGTYLTPSTASSPTEVAQISLLTIYTVTGMGSNGCTASVEVPVATVPVGGTINPAKSIICSGTSKVLTVTGAAGNSYQWQSSPDGLTGWSDISGATKTTYTAAPVSTTYYRMMAKSNACWDVASTMAIVNISSPSIIVSVTGKTSTNITLDWTPVGGGNYDISYTGNPSGNANAVTPPYTILGLTANESYNITVTQTGLSCSASGTLSNVKTLCAVPTGVAVSSPANKQLKVDWNGDAGSYRVYYREVTIQGSYSYVDVTTVSNTGTVTITNRLYRGGTYEVYVVHKDCPSPGDFGQNSTLVYTIVKPLSTCISTPSIDEVKSICPGQIEVSMSGSPTGNYVVFIQRLTPTIANGYKYNVTGGNFQIHVGQPGQTFMVGVASWCTSGTRSDMVMYPGGITIKPLCNPISNLVLSNPTCSGFTGSWNREICSENQVSTYQFFMKRTGTLTWNSYPVSSPISPVSPYLKVNWLGKGYEMSCYVKANYVCNGYVIGGPSSTIQNITTLSAGCREEEQDMLQPEIPSSQIISADNSEAISIYPNPNGGQFALDISRMSNDEVQVKIEVMNVLGQTVLTNISEIKDGHGNEIVTLPETTAAGTYFVRVTSGSNIYTAKVNVSR